MEIFAIDADARAACERLAKLPAELGGPLLSYLGLFRPRERALSWSRVRKLLDELAPLIEAGHVRRNGRDWPVTNAAWRAGFTHMADARERLSLPLKSHGYLLEILAGDARTADARAEALTHQQARDQSQRRADPQRLDAAVSRTWITGENRVRARQGLPPMTQDEEISFLAKQP
jgi:hypothetical protein